jgi:hypothetical protein
MPDEYDREKGYAAKAAFTLSCAILMRALQGLHSVAGSLATPEAIFADLDRLIESVESVDQDDEHNQEYAAFFASNLDLLKTIVRQIRVSHPGATLDDAAAEMRYMTSLMRSSQKKNKPG